MRLIPIALAVLLPLAAGPALAQGGPHPDVRPPTPSRPSGGPSFTPSLSLSFTIKPKEKPVEARDAEVDEQTPDTVVFIVRDAGANPQALASRAGVSMAEAVPLTSAGLVMVVGKLAAGDTPAAAIARLSAIPGVAWAQPNHVYQGLAGRTPRGYELQGLTAEAMAQPAGGILAMIDTAVALDHEVFAGAAIEQRLFSAPMSPGAHGTAVAALLVGGGAVQGTGQGARLISLAAFQSSGADGPALSQTRYLAKALDAAARLRPGVLNLSFGGPSDRLLETLVDAIAAKGVCMAAAAGNGGRNGRIPFPASHPAVLGVTAVDERLRIYSRATAGWHVDVAAIGVDLMAATPGGYRRVSGSSFATAVVSGALMRLPACTRDGNPGAMLGAVAATARDLGAAGPDEVFGAGLFRLPPPR